MRLVLDELADCERESDVELPWERGAVKDADAAAEVKDESALGRRVSGRIPNDMLAQSSCGRSGILSFSLLPSSGPLRIIISGGGSERSGWSTTYRRPDMRRRGGRSLTAPSLTSAPEGL